MTVLFTKKLKPNQRELLLNAGLQFVEYDAIRTQEVAFTLSRKHKKVIITSQNGARALLNNLSSEQLESIKSCFAVGEKTTALLVENGIKVTKTAQNGEELARFIVENHKIESFTYFCGRQRRDELPTLLKENNVACKEVVVYETHQITQSFDRTFDGILFFSPSGVNAFAKANKNTPAIDSIAFCIGETTATTARLHFKKVIVSDATSIESTIAKAVKTLKEESRT
ncbi:uroporphyrinogen-III synthase [Dokdonia sp. Dokd-P16]|uniref:uroporphyrinogen-III synthase n=1 Tax=Dokdonia sp. Dokd-P16 TaxID=2173169 RepID=UPI000D5469D6|nr:uroporphyrinogen-III synthase [Dokdonia sp. Dokd-P16]AWH73862.1 uroporphyrinogen-III synthase [Dokdonia sp. Dokd-P16]